jgi:hypothetical protein
MPWLVSTKTGDKFAASMNDNCGQITTSVANSSVSTPQIANIGLNVRNKNGLDSQCCGSGFGIRDWVPFLPQDPGSGMGESQHPDPGSGMNNLDHIF